MSPPRSVAQANRDSEPNGHPRLVASTIGDRQTNRAPCAIASTSPARDAARPGQHRICRVPPHRSGCWGVVADQRYDGRPRHWSTSLPPRQRRPLTTRICSIAPPTDKLLPPLALEARAAGGEVRRLPGQLERVQQGRPAEHPVNRVQAAAGRGGGGEEKCAGYRVSGTVGGGAAPPNTR